MCPAASLSPQPTRRALRRTVLRLAAATSVVCAVPARTSIHCHRSLSCTWRSRHPHQGRAQRRRRPGRGVNVNSNTPVGRKKEKSWVWGGLTDGRGGRRDRPG
ncbi:hypothetical protein BJV78DRAFT_1255661, partial [Lactifluus subvellereus]